MSVSDADIAFAKELFADLEPLTTRKMMDGLCLYRDGTIFAILHSDGSLWIKGAGDFQGELDARGLERWTYRRDGKKESPCPTGGCPTQRLTIRRKRSRWHVKP
ncbi:TfoX/Sxy family protein [Fontisubflavum oceani]|uniref:TfoX/Sxy family protein n=1 Tax=Fontisubflavum oceani TaxID=2978973 RepID=UPI002ED22841